MKKLNEMITKVKTTILSMDRKNKTILGVITVALVGALVAGGYQLTTIGKTADDKVKQEETKKAEDSKKDSSTKKEEKHKEDSKKSDKKTDKKEDSASKKKEDKAEKEQNTKNQKDTTSTKKSDSGKSDSSNTANSTSNKTDSSKSESASSNSTNNSNSNKQETVKPTPKPEPKPTPAPTPKPEPTPQPSEPTIDVEATENMKQQIIADAQNAPGGMFSTMGAADTWAASQVDDPNSPYYGKSYMVVDVGIGAETFGYGVAFN